MSKASIKSDERAQAISELRKILKPGDTVYTVLRHVSTSGMSRRIDLYAIKRNRPLFLSGYAGIAMGYTRQRDKDGLTVSGCGMDMGFHLVYELGRTLYPKGFTPAKAGKAYGRNGSPATEIDTDGGYALNHRWL